MTMDSSASDESLPPDPEDLVPPSSGRTLDDYLAMQDAIGDRTRFLVVYILTRHGSHTPTQLAERVDVPANTLHYHLNKLDDVGLVRKQRETTRETEIGRTYYETTDSGRAILEHGVVGLIQRTDGASFEAE